MCIIGILNEIFTKCNDMLIDGPPPIAISVFSSISVQNVPIIEWFWSIVESDDVLASMEQVDDFLEAERFLSANSRNEVQLRYLW